MVEHVTWLTEFVNHHLGDFALALLSALHIKPENPDLPIPEHVVMAGVVLIICTLLALFLRLRLSVEKPGATQQIAELLLTNPVGFGIKDLLEENVHHGALKMIPFVGSISVFVLFSNLLSVIPVFAAPTANKTVPLACAILTFLYFNWQGVRHHGVGRYLLTFAGSPRKLGDWFLAILLFLNLNGLDLRVEQVEAIQTILQVAAGRMSETELSNWIRTHMRRAKKS